jgi:hypothetical protein
LEYCTQYLKNKDSECSTLTLWHLIGTQGPGILYDDLKEIMCNESPEEQKAKEEEELTSKLMEEIKINERSFSDSS